MTMLQNTDKLTATPKSSDLASDIEVTSSLTDSASI